MSLKGEYMNNDYTKIVNKNNNSDDNNNDNIIDFITNNVSINIKS